MVGGNGVKYLMDARANQNRPGVVNDDLRAAEMAIWEDRVSLWARITTGVKQAFAGLSVIWRKEPESTEAALARLASTSPHLLADIGVKLVTVNTVPVTFAGRGFVRPLPIDDVPAAAAAGVGTAAPVAETTRQPDLPMAGLVPAV